MILPDQTPYCRKMRANCLDQNCGCIPREVLPNGHVEPVGNEFIITVHWTRWFGFVAPEIRKYRGNSTVWHDAFTGKRQNAFIESYLCDIITKHKWGRNETR